jgi:hypothetical protein
LIVAAAFALQCLGLPQSAARLLFDFIFHPISYLHPDRRALYVPAKLHTADCSPERLSQALMLRLGLGHDVALEWQNPAHRAALLPWDALQKLAWRMALSQLAPSIRRIIVRSELAQLQSQFGPDDWTFVYSHDHLPSSSESQELLDGVTLAEWPVRLQKWGWRTLEAACGELPVEVGQRCLLKLPVVSSARHAEPERALALLHDIYPALVAQWNAEWDANWDRL